MKFDPHHVYHLGAIEQRNMHVLTLVTEIRKLTVSSIYKLKTLLGNKSFDTSGHFVNRCLRPNIVPKYLDKSLYKLCNQIIIHTQSSEYLYYANSLHIHLLIL